MQLLTTSAVFTSVCFLCHTANRKCSYNSGHTIKKSLDGSFISIAEVSLIDFWCFHGAVWVVHCLLRYRCAVFLCGCSVVAVWLAIQMEVGPSALACSSTEAFQLLRRDFSKISCPLLNYNLLFYLSFFPRFSPPSRKEKKAGLPPLLLLPTGLCVCVSASDTCVYVWLAGAVWNCDSRLPSVLLLLLSPSQWAA